jgi:hypothetical protein
VEPRRAPSFWNPELGYLETASEALDKVAEFLSDEDRPWPLRRQLERRRDDLLKATNFLTRTHHSVALIGDIGVGKSTALSFLFDLLVSSSPTAKPIDRVVLETGAGGTTICEVHIKGTRVRYLAAAYGRQRAPAARRRPLHDEVGVQPRRAARGIIG